MRFVVVADEDGTSSFTALWGETMVARPGDAIVQDLNNAGDVSDRQGGLRLHLRDNEQSA
jgi:hypothetical protein